MLLLALVYEIYLISSTVCIVALLTTCLRSTAGLSILCNLCWDKEIIINIDVRQSALLKWDITFLSSELPYLDIAYGDLNKVVDALFAMKCKAYMVAYEW